MSRFKLSYVLPFLLITILCIGGVEAFYYFAEKQLMVGGIDKKSGFQPNQVLASTSEIDKKPQELDIKAITRRNLFSSRDKTPADNLEKDPLAGVEMSSLAVVLMGTVTGPDDQQRAIIYDKKERRQDLYQEGDFIYQAAIKKILRGKVIVSLNGKNEMLDISEARNVNIPRVPKPAVPQTVVQPVVSRPVGAPEPTQTAEATLTAPVTESNVVAPKPASRKPLRSFRGGVIVKGRNTSGANSNQ